LVSFPSHANCLQLATEKHIPLDNNNKSPCNKRSAKHMSQAMTGLQCPTCWVINCGILQYGVSLRMWQHSNVCLVCFALQDLLNGP